MTTTNHKTKQPPPVENKFVPFAHFMTLLDTPTLTFPVQRCDVITPGRSCFGRAPNVTSQNLATAQTREPSPLWLPPPWAECVGLHERSCLQGRAPGASERWRDLWCWRCCSRPSCALVNGRGETARDWAGPDGTERRRLTVVPTGRVPAARAGPGLESAAPSAVSPGLRSGVV